MLHSTYPRVRALVHWNANAIVLLLLSICFGIALHAQQLDVRANGAKCDGLAPDEADAFNAAIAAAGRNCNGYSQAHIDLPMGKTCKFTHPLVVNAACVGIRGNGATLDFSSLKSGPAITVTYSGKAPIAINQPGTWENFHLRGPGPKTSTVGLLIQSPENIFRKIDINNFGVGIEAGNNFFLNQFNSVKIWAVGTGFSCPRSITNAGENITFNQGVIAGAATAINVLGGCEVHGNQMSFDGLTGSVYSSVNGSGRFDCNSCHIEYFAATTAPIFDIAGCNSWTSIDIEGGIIQSDVKTAPNVLALIRNDPQKSCGGSGSWAYFSRVFFARLLPSAKCAAGSGATCVVGSNSGQVRIDLSTVGDGGGSFGNAHMP